MKYSIPILFILIIWIGLTDGFGQATSLPQFLKEKQVWEEKLIVLYAPADKQYLIKDQLNLMHPFIQDLKKENITVVVLPSQLCEANMKYLEGKMKAQKNRLNIWVLDEKGTLRMSGTKLTSLTQFIRVLNIENRSNAVAKAQFLRD